MSELTPNNVYSLLKRDEGDNSKLYYLNTIPHIGVGHNLASGPDLTPAARDMILSDDVAFVVESLHSRVKFWNRLNDIQQAVLISVAFQCGVAGLMAFTKMLQALSLGDLENAADELLVSTLAKQNVQRTQRLAQMLRTNQWV
jgi:lysozyme